MNPMAKDVRTIENPNDGETYACLSDLILYHEEFGHWLRSGGSHSVPGGSPVIAVQSLAASLRSLRNG